ncbi:MAG: nucleotide sugar dehydrogenase [Deltaproteobacteria bacterium]|nr:nucleotide sugar dehydrogenase [Deltaproteobacteria bacterium]MBI3296394.1 nucleotide sugar dehydrogenase [Deltaproteobacteria bacterium]
MKTHIAILGGCGHVGLPLGITFASRGYAVTLVDINARAVKMVNDGIMPFVEAGGEEALKSVIGKFLTAMTDGAVLKDSDVVIVVTGTPVDNHLNPRVSDVTDVIDQYLPFLNSSQLLVLRSTLAPGVTELIWKHLKKEKPGLKLAFCPERVAQGYAIEEIYNFPQIVSAFEADAEDRAAELFSAIAPEILRLTPREAELAKLFSNTWRYIHFAIANQHYMIAESCGADFQRIYHALTHNYPRLKNLARPGLTAGPCLFKDTMQLSASYNNNYFLGHAAMLVNEGLPTFLVEQLESKMQGLEGKRIGLLGMAFKPDHDDTRESLSYKVRKVLRTKMAVVLDTDVYQPTHAKLDEILKTSDGFILGVPHTEYRDLKLGNRPFVDCWGVWTPTPDLSQSPIKRTPSSTKRAEQMNRV